MFQYILQGWYILTIVLVACIVGYIAYYVLERISYKRAKKNHHEETRIYEQGDSDIIERTTIDKTEDDEGNVTVTVESAALIIPHAHDTSSEESSDDDEEIDEDLKRIMETNEVIVANPTDDSQPADDELVIKKHKVKNIAEGVSREDILQDKHEKNLQKVKYEAMLSKQRNDMAGYEKKLIEGLILDPDDLDIYRQLADFYFSEGKYTKALSMFRKILTFDPNDHHALWQMGEIYIEQGQFEDAQVFIEKALTFSPDNPKYYISLIDICIAKNDLDQALIHLEKIVALRPRNISYLMALGEMYEKLGRKEDAKMTYFRVLEVDPLHIDVKHILKKF